jgi:hypothetical protein
MVAERPYLAVAQEFTGNSMIAPQLLPRGEWLADHVRLVIDHPIGARGRAAPREEGDDGRAGHNVGVIPAGPSRLYPRDIARPFQVKTEEDPERRPVIWHGQSDEGNKGCEPRSHIGLGSQPPHDNDKRPDRNDQPEGRDDRRCKRNKQPRGRVDVASTIECQGKDTEAVFMASSSLGGIVFHEFRHQACDTVTAGTVRLVARLFETDHFVLACARHFAKNISAFSALAGPERDFAASSFGNIRHRSQQPFSTGSSAMCL